MSDNQTISEIGESKLIDLIDTLIFEETQKRLIRDDCFFYSYNELSGDKEVNDLEIILNSDMFVSSTDRPSQMSPFQMGYKSVIMNISDLIVKGVEPVSIIISLGISSDFNLREFKDLIQGVLKASNFYDMTYIGGDINQTQEIIINPTVFGFSTKENIFYRKGMNEGDLLVSNRKFGLTGVGFDILLNQKEELKDVDNYKLSINSVLEPEIGLEAITLAKQKVVTASIDSSDGLARSLRELMVSNPSLGFEVELNQHLIHQEATRYSEEFGVPIERLIFDAGEEFNHLFTIAPNDFESVVEKVNKEGGLLYQIGKVISEPEIYIISNDQKLAVKNWGYEHFGEHM